MRNITRMPLANLKRTVITRAYAASSVGPIWPMNAWLMMFMPNVENLVKIAGPATIQSLFVSPQTFSLICCCPSSSTSTSPPGLSSLFSSFFFISPSISVARKPSYSIQQWWNKTLIFYLDRCSVLFLDTSTCKKGKWRAEIEYNNLIFFFKLPFVITWMFGIYILLFLIQIKG